MKVETVQQDTVFKLTNGGFAGANVSFPAAFKMDLDVPFILEDWFRPKQVGFLIAPPALGKTAVTAAICAHISLGRRVGNIEVTRSSVYYMAPEDPAGVCKRAMGHLVDAHPQATPFVVVSRTPSFLCEKHVDKIVEDVIALQERSETDHTLIVVDTTNRVLDGADENSATVMAEVIGSAEHIARETNSYVLFIHHTSHGDSKRGRGSSAIRGNTDDEFLLVSGKGQEGEKIVLLTPQKQKDCEIQKPLAFEITSHVLGENSRGRVVSVPMAIPLKKDVAPARSPANKNKSPATKEPSNAERRGKDLVRALRELDRHTPNAWHDLSQIKPLVGDAFNDARNKADSLRKAIQSSLKTLVDSREVEVKERKLYRVARPDTQVANQNYAPGPRE